MKYIIYWKPETDILSGCFDRYKSILTFCGSIKLYILTKCKFHRLLKNSGTIISNLYLETRIYFVLPLKVF